jgi:LuxR family maltose regulon positive regulatory protein
MNEIDALIRTKLRPPFVRSELVSRPRLQERIAQGLRRPLTLITAPAGFGKTTLVTIGVAHRGIAAAWLSLEKDDNQVERFLSYLLAAIQEVDPVLGNEARQLMAISQQICPERVLTAWVNDLVTAQAEVALVLDDYHVISNPAVHECVTWLLEHCPKTFHLVIASRSDPPFPLARWRARGQVVELRASELSFTKSEAAQFLNDVMGLGLDSETVATLEERTEGWITGLQMAALSMRGREDPGEFIEGFSGTHRYILDYLLEEVLALQPSEVQRFLLSTSVLKRLTAPLCEALLTDGMSAEGAAVLTLESPLAAPPIPILEYLERRNLFLVPLDDERIWYRYHHLFADLLRARLQQTHQDQDIVALHTRAAHWYEGNGFTYEAIHHASLTGDEEWVERLIEQNYMEMFQRRDSSSIRYWTGKLDQELIYQRPRLCVHEAMSRSWLGQLDEAEVFLDKAEDRISGDGATLEAQTLLGHLAYVRSRVNAMRGDVQSAIRLSLTARRSTPANNQALLGGIGVMLGYAYFLNGDFGNAAETLNETINSGIGAGAVNSTVGAYCVLARLHALQGRLHRSLEVYQKAETLAREMGERDLGIRGVVDVGIADVLCEWNDLDTALVKLQQGLALLPLWAKADDLILAYVTLVRIHLAQGHRKQAIDALEKAAELVHTRGVFPEAHHAVESAQVKMWLVQGDVGAASRWAASQEERWSADGPFTFENERTHIDRARVRIALQEPRQALTLLSPLAEAARSAGRRGRVVEIQLLQALAMQEVGNVAGARAALSECLTLAAFEDYARVFLDEGQHMRSLLTQWLAHADNDSSQKYVTRLLTYFDTEAPPTGGLIDPLSPRELEVLHLIALGKTNREIARQLVVAPGTIKAHTSNIYRKLDVANRTEAVARARQLGIFP